MKPRILIVDDDEAITQQLFWTLSEDYEVITANDLQTAVRRATIYEPDVSLLDLYMLPSGGSADTGLRIIEYIKSHLPESKVVVMTTTSAIEAAKTCHELGADEFLGKPFETEELLSTMHRVAPPQLDVI